MLRYYFIHSFTFVLLFLCYGCLFSQNSGDLTVQKSNNIIDSVSVIQDYRPCGRGNQREIILKAEVFVNQKCTSPILLKYLTMNMLGTTDASDVTSIKIFSTKDVDHLDERASQDRLFDYMGNKLCKTLSVIYLNNFQNNSDSSKFSTSSFQNNKGVGSSSLSSFELTDSIVFQLDGLLYPGINYLWITYGIDEDAKVGNYVDASLLNIATEMDTFNIAKPVIAGKREIFLKRRLVFAPGDYNSTDYRIPSIITAKDGSIVVFSDKRKFNRSDLPSDIDIVSKRSVDGGQTWSSPTVIARGKGVYKGFGDAAVSLTNDSAGLILVCVGGPGLFESTPSNPIRSFMCRSFDNGNTWTNPVDITNQIYGEECADPIRKRWYASFFASGRGLITSTGRIIFVIAVRETSGNILNNYAVYSDDNGKSWNVSQLAFVDGDEAKTVELEDGSILMSIRHKDYRYYCISKDGGETWHNPSFWNEMPSTPCNASIIRFKSKKSGDERNIILHTLPDNPSSRENLTVFISYDEGVTWPEKKRICPYGSGYSSLTLLPDGTLGLFVEEDFYHKGEYYMYFTQFSLDYLDK